MSMPFISWCLVVVIAIAALIVHFAERLPHNGNTPHGLRLEHRKVAVETEQSVRRHSDKN